MPSTECQVDLSGARLQTFFRIYSKRCEEIGIDVDRSLIQVVAQSVSLAEAAPSCAGPSSAAPLSLRLRQMHLGLGGWECAAPALACLPWRAINVQECYMGDAGLRVFAHALTHYSSLPGLHNDGGAATIRPPIGNALQTLNLSGVSIKDGSALVPAIHAVPHLRSLDLSWNQLGKYPDGFVVLCAALRLHPSLEALSFASNFLEGACGSPVVSALAELIVAAGREGGTLISLALEDNQLGAYYDYDWHAAGLGCHDSALNLFNKARIAALPATAHGVHGAHPLLDALILNNTLEVLSMENNALPDSLLAWVAARLRVNRRSKGRGAPHTPGSAFYSAASIESIIASAATTMTRRLRELDDEPPVRTYDEEENRSRRWTTADVSAFVQAALDLVKVQTTTTLNEDREAAALPQ